MATNTFYMKKGDTFPNMLVQLLDENGSPVDLTGATVTCRISQKGAGNAMIEREATIVTPQIGATKGRCYHTFTALDTAVVGNYRVEWKVEFLGGQVATFPRGTVQYNTLTVQNVVD